MTRFIQSRANASMPASATRSISRGLRRSAWSRASTAWRGYPASFFRREKRSSDAHPTISPSRRTAAVAQWVSLMPRTIIGDRTEKFRRVSLTRTSRSRLRRRESAPERHRAAIGPRRGWPPPERAASRGHAAYSCWLWLAIIVDARHWDTNRQCVCVKTIEFAFAYWEGFGDGGVTVQ